MAYAESLLDQIKNGCVDGLEDQRHLVGMTNVLQSSTIAMSPESANVGWFSGWQVTFSIFQEIAI